jgi:diguanylate cyclase (GGDEF)-like protein/PAS domain S-box-containing protein
MNSLPEENSLAGAPARARDDALQARVDAALFHYLISNSAIPLIGSAVGGLLVVAAHFGSANHTLLAGWISLILITIAIRAWLTRRCEARLKASGHQPDAALRYALTTSLSGMVWGAAALFIPAAPPLAMVVTVTAIQALVMGAVLTLGAYMPAFLAFALPAILPMILVFVLGGGMANAVLALYSLIFLALMTSIAVRFNRSLAHSWRVTFEKVDLVGSLTESRDRQRELNERLELALDAAGLDLWENNLVSGEVVRAAAKVYTELGYDGHEITPFVEDILRIAHPDDAPVLMSAINNHLTGITPQYRSEFRLRAKNGDWVWYANYGKVVDRAGCERGQRFIGVTFNINERKQKEDILALREQESRTLIENSPDTVARYDGGGRRIFVNHAFGALAHGGAASLLGKTPAEAPGGAMFENYERAIREVFAGGKNAQFELRWHGPDGAQICSHIRLTAERDAAGKITSVLGIGRDITELIESRNKLRLANEQLESMNSLLQSMATSDPLTQLPNRRLLMSRLKQALAGSQRSGHSGALLLIDLDNFKDLNDSLGHDIGDLLLQQVARRLEACVREGDTVARLGGDEFVVMLQDLNKNALEAAEQTELVGNKILTSLNHPYRLVAHEHRNTPSIGATLFCGNGQSIDSLMKQADIAMYQSKKAGRNTLHFFDPKMQEAINARAALERELHAAIDRREFELHYQLQVDSAGRPIGAEALLRWPHPEHGMVPPGDFIPLAEETGLIMPIGQWVLEMACAQLKAWEYDAATRDLALSVNVSAREFRQTGFVTQVLATVHRHAIDPTRLKLELTESLLLEDIEDTIDTMNALNDVGVQISLDDFGTGFSSLQYLKRLPLDQLKIDQSFVRDIAADSSDRAIVRTIIAMAHSLNLDVIAEGVETEDQRQFLQESGCTHYQGYLFGRPQPIEKFEASLKAAG